jgi:hypothetical protein
MLQTTKKEIIDRIVLEGFLGNVCTALFSSETVIKIALWSLSNLVATDPYSNYFI